MRSSIVTPRLIGPHVEIGWRLVRSAWGKDYATEAARAALTDAFDRVRLTEIFAYTAPDNLRSQAVLRRLHLVRDQSRDYFWHHDHIRAGQGLVWVAYRSRRSPPERPLS
jgi:RimJ/RimL family protein N-acetyltransferase